MDQSRYSRRGAQVTMRMVAATCGVHISTVSRALARAAQGLPPLSEAQERIVRVSRELGFVPNPNAASLTTHRSASIGVLVPQLADSVLAAIYDSIDAKANSAGYDTFVANTHDSPEEQQRRIGLLLGRRVDGLILGDAHSDGTNLDALAQSGVKFVLVNRHAGEHPSVCADDEMGGRLVAEHLASLGHRHIAIIGGPPWASTSQDRIRGCLRELESRGITVRDDFIIEGSGFAVADGKRAAELLLSADPRPTAIFAVNDETAIGAIGALRDRGLRAGHDIAIVGYNDVPLAAELSIPLTSVRTPLAEIGTESVSMLLDLIEGRTPASKRLETTLCIRESSTGNPTAALAS